MELLKKFYNTVSPLSETTWNEIIPLFREEWLPKNQYFIRENEVARKIAFLESGVVRAYFIISKARNITSSFS